MLRKRFTLGQGLRSERLVWPKLWAGEEGRSIVKPKLPLCAGRRGLKGTKGPPPTVRERWPGTKNFPAGEGMRWEKVSPFLGGILWASGEGTVQPPRWLRAHLPAPMCPAPSSLTWGQAREQFRLNLDQRTLIWGWVAYPNHGEAQRWGWMRGKTDTPEIHCATTHTDTTRQRLGTRPCR